MKLFLFMTLSLLLNSASYGKPTLNILIEGVPPAKQEYYKSKILFLQKGQASLSEIQNAVEILYLTETLSGVDVYLDDNEENKTNIIFKLTLRQTIRKIKFLGNSSYSSSDLIAELGFSEGEKYSEDKIKLGVEGVKKFYNLNGFLNAQVGAHFTQMETNDLTLVVDIEEGSPCLIQEIRFESPNSKLNKDLLKRVSGSIKKRFSQFTLNEIQTDLSGYLLKEKYYSATLNAGQTIFNQTKTFATLSFTIADPYSYGLIFEGNEQFTTYQILNNLKLDETNKLSGSPVDDLTERIVKFYKRRGYANISVKYKENLIAEDFNRRINFTISEGVKVKIKNIIIEGTFSRSPSYYSDFIFDHSGDLISSKYYNSEDLDQGAKDLVSELQNEGFIAAQIPSMRIDFDKKRDSVVVKIVLNEGPQTFIDKIVFKGANKLNPNEIEKIIGLRAGAPLRLSDLAEASNKIVDLYRSHGFLDIKLLNQNKNIINYSDDNKKATLTFDIYEGPLVTVNGIVVEGNSFTKEFVIKRELQFSVGDVLTPEKISYSEARLQSLGLFGTIEIRTLSDDPKEGKRTVLIYVTERNPGILKAGIGADNELTLSLKGYVGAAYRNLFGTGRGVNARVQVNDKVKYSFYEKELNFGYSEPFIFDTANNLKLSGLQSTNLWYINENSSVPRGEVVYAVDTLQADIVLERDLARNLKLLFELYGFAHTNTYEIFNQAPPSSLDIGSIGPTLIYDLRDNAFNPSRGFISSATFEYAAPELHSSSTVNYAKTIGSATKYIPLGPLTFAQEAKAGYIGNLSHEENGAIPQSKVFVLGGRSTIRGFEPYEAVPKLIEIPFGIRSAYNLFYLLKSELRFPISGNFGGVLFYDGGHVEYAGFGQQFWWRDSAGLGFRYNTAVGPVSLEYGFKLNRDNTRGETPGALHFSIGVF